MLLQDEFPEACRFAASVFPSEDDDVITSPYNAVLSLAELTQHADAVFPLENQALMDMCSLMQARSGSQAGHSSSILSGPIAGQVLLCFVCTWLIRCLIAITDGFAWLVSLFPCA